MPLFLQLQSGAKAAGQVHDEDLLLLLLLLQWLWGEPHYLEMAFTHLSEHSLP